MAIKPKQSKRYTLSKLAPEWRETIFGSIKSHHLKLAVAVLSASGCRPCELETGVAIRLREGVLSIGINGAKVDLKTGRGQPLRMLDIDANSPWGTFLLEQVSQTDIKGIVVRYDAGGISQRLREKSKELWPRRKSLVSAYSYRHFMGQLMKQADEGSEKIAATLGHASDYSQTAYGRIRGKRQSSDQHGILNAVASNPIRHSVKSDKLAKLIKRQAIKSEADK